MHETSASQKMSGVMLSSSSSMFRKTVHQASTTIYLKCGSFASQKHQQRSSAVARMHAASLEHMNSFNNVLSHSRKKFEPISPVLGRFTTRPCALRCFSAYEQQSSGRRLEAGSDFPRPPVIPFQKDLANYIHLIGHVGKKPDIKYFDSGKVCARSSMAVRKTARLEDAPSWFALEFWDELAEIAAHHLKKGDKIHVAGVVVVDKFEKDQENVTIVKVVVRDVNYIALQTESYSDKNMSSQDKKLAKEKLWQEFFENPSEWWDNRVNKVHGSPSPRDQEFNYTLAHVDIKDKQKSLSW
ncbi:hypothetical protein O6H91_04G025600 [Diphasiastrum complanatum]|uniref:Uncharacterized protein n=1 Tax=Diphasiastrum complanatum TaxID=34168 RepID=A0ACC2DV85_DIPCM|nr:hypothetical protein O6H91_04G025600 [Diphasiastrum complanatum]